MRSACCLVASWLFLSSLSGAQLVQTPTVTYANGVVVGTQNAMQKQDQFLGIPYAQPPTGSNRLRPPQPMTTNFGTLSATASPYACPQFGLTIYDDRTIQAAPTATTSANVYDFFQPQPTNVDNPEDCLRLNVQRPSGTNATSKLPVLAWFWGSGIVNGGVSPTYDPTSWIAKAMSLNEPFIYVSGNYRLGPWAYMPGRQMAAEGATNIGLRDQRAILHWIADNVAAFGGDPDKVTIFGNSGGALCVLDQTIVNRGDHTYKGKPLFRSVMLSSGSTLAALDNTHPKAQGTFDNMANATGCDPSSADVVDCLRKADFDTFREAGDSLRMPYDTINLSFLPRPDNTSDFFPSSPEVAIANGEFAKVPTMIGNQQDEGAFWGILFTDTNGNNDTQVVEIFKTMFVDAPRTSLQSFIATYPKDITAGCPYNTGILNEIYPGYKRLSSIIGDMTMTLVRRRYLNTVAQHVKTWSYLATYDHNVLPVIGTCHSTDMLAIWYGSASAIAIDQLYTRFTSFIAHQDPNALNQFGYAEWPEYDLVKRKMISFDSTGTSFLKDDFRAASYKVHQDVYSQFKL